jgi:diamine N-acetyltransferase
MIKGQITILRAAEPSDLDVLYNWENDANSWKVSGTLIPFSRETLSRYLNSAQDIIRDGQYRFLISNRDSEPVGFVDLFDFDPVHRRTGIGILISENLRNKGYAKDALNSALSHCFKSLNLRQVWCSIQEDNPASRKLFETAGFATCGHRKDWFRVDNRWTNELLYQYLNPEEI